MPRALLICAICALCTALIARGAPVVETEAQPESICGPDVVTIGDAWEKIQLECGGFPDLLRSRSLVKMPQKLSAIVAHLRFIQVRSNMIFGRKRMLLAKGVSSGEMLASEMSRAALAEDTSGLAEKWGDLKSAIQLVAAQLPDEAFIPSASFAHLLPPAASTLFVQPAVFPALHAGKPARVVFTLISTKDMGVALPDDIFATHGAKLHALVCDRTLTDYHHEHPVPTARPGEWEFTFTPALDEHYRVWINVVPKKTGREEFDHNDITPAKDAPTVPADALVPALVSQAGDLRGEIQWNTGGGLHRNQSASATLSLTGKDGHPLRDLEPLMGAFAHLVGIADDYSTILHVHPSGGNPKPEERGGPELDFSLRPTRPGFYRMFVQIMRRGKIELLTFGFVVD